MDSLFAWKGQHSPLIYVFRDLIKKLLLQVDLAVFFDTKSSRGQQDIALRKRSENEALRTQISRGLMTLCTKLILIWYIVDPA